MKGLLLNRAEWRVAVLSFLIKIALFWLAELVICELDYGRMICRLVARGFWPCLFSFALMDVFVIPRLRRWWQQR